MKLNVKSFLRRIPLVEKCNASIKCAWLKRQNKLIELSYRRSAKAAAISYTSDQAIKHFSTRLEAKDWHAKAHARKPLRVFWVGANKAQDYSGIIQGLQEICELHIFSNPRCDYGIWYGDGSQNPDEIRRVNDEALIKQVVQCHDDGGLDLVFGQMFGQWLSAGVLQSVQAMGIPVINIAMDDRLPVSWGMKHGNRLGAVGLCPGTDLVLTTTSASCLNYKVEGCPALFWPLASDPEQFSPREGEDRDIDVAFVGNKYGIRSKLIDYLQKKSIDIACYGAGWPNGPVDSEQNAEISRRAKIILGVGTIGHCSDEYTLKLRDFDALMACSLYLTHRNPDLEALFNEGEEIEYYSSFSEAEQKIKHYLKNEDERRRVAFNGHSRALQDFSWKHRFTLLFRQLGLLQ